MPHADLPSPLVGEGARRADEGEAPARRLTTFARHLRHDATEAEKRLWGLLRDRRFSNYKFRRQVPVGRYIADFACYAAHLVIELDGSQHAESERDKFRDAELKKRGFRVLRVWNNELTHNRQGVLEAIWAELVASPSSGAARHLLPRGEKGRGTMPQADFPSPLVGEGARRADEGDAASTTGGVSHA